MSDYQDIKYSSAKDGKNLLQTLVSSVTGLCADVFLFWLDSSTLFFKRLSMYNPTYRLI